MTSPIGRAFIEVHADTDEVGADLERDLGRIADEADKELDKTGKKFGDKVSDSLIKRIASRGKEYAKAIGDATKNSTVVVRSRVVFDNIRDRIQGAFGRRGLGDQIEVEIGDALDRASRPGGPFSKFSQALSDAIGAGFNVSGRSPLIAVLLPALLALVGVIVAALQAVNALVAVLIVLPSILFSVIAQIGVVAIAFQGLGTAISGAFSAKNAKELNRALKDLQPSAQFFVRTLLPLKNFFKELQESVQQNFFSRLGNVMLIIQKTLGPALLSGMSQLAKDMGTFFRELGLFFASPTFVKFVNEIFPATGRWMAKFGPSFVDFLTGLFDMANAAMPFLDRLGTMVSGFLTLLGLEWSRFARSPEFQVWLDDMAVTLQLVFDLLSETFNFLMVFLGELNKAGGQHILETLVEALQRLSFFLSSPVGQKAMEALVNLSIFGIESFTGLLLAVLSVMAAFEVLGEWILNTGGPAIAGFFKAIGQFAVDASTFVGVWLERIVGAIWGWITGIGRAIGNFFIRLWTDIKRFFDSITKGGSGVTTFLKGLPGKILAAIGNLGGLLFKSGQNLISGLIAGIRSMIQPFLNMINWIVAQIGRVFPGSPAKEGPLSGRGYVLYRGQRMMQDFIKGIEMETPNLRSASMNATSNIIFGPNSIQMSIAGPVPDQAQARTFGSALGESAANAIAARNTRLAVRTL